MPTLTNPDLRPIGPVDPNGTTHRRSKKDTRMTVCGRDIGKTWMAGARPSDCPKCGRTKGAN